MRVVVDLDSQPTITPFTYKSGHALHLQSRSDAPRSDAPELGVVVVAFSARSPQEAHRLDRPLDLDRDPPLHAARVAGRGRR